MRESYTAGDDRHGYFSTAIANASDFLAGGRIHVTLLQNSALCCDTNTLSKICTGANAFLTLSGPIPYAQLQEATPSSVGDTCQNFD